jgi:hypothetical protein
MKVRKRVSLASEFSHPPSLSRVKETRKRSNSSLARGGLIYTDTSDSMLFYEAAQLKSFGMA